jgi:hypothetical protein
VGHVVSNALTLFEQEKHAFGMALALLASAAVLIWVVAMRREGRGGVELADIVLALVPIIVWLILAGGLNEVALGRDELSIKFSNTLHAPISSTLSPLPVYEIPAAEKPRNPPI